MANVTSDELRDLLNVIPGGPWAWSGRTQGPGLRKCCNCARPVRDCAMRAATGICKCRD